jgi:putative flippase GtrA
MAGTPFTPLRTYVSSGERSAEIDMNTNPTRSPWSRASLEGMSLRERVVRHLIVGGSGTAGYFIFVALLVEKMAVPPVLSVIIGYSVLATYTYLVSRRWVYHTNSKHLPTIFRFLVLLGLGFVLNTGIMYFVTESLAQSYLWGLFGSAAIVPATNFALSYFWVYK